MTTMLEYGRSVKMEKETYGYEVATFFFLLDQWAREE